MIPVSNGTDTKGIEDVFRTSFTSNCFLISLPIYNINLETGSSLKQNSID